MRAHQLLLIAAMATPLLSVAQQNETLHAGKQVQAERENQTFRFPDNTVLNKNELNERVEAKTKELAGYIKLLAGNNSEATTNALIDKAMKLFNNNEYATVTVTRQSQPHPVTVPVRTYLKRLSRLHYNGNVRITWRNAQYLSNFNRQPDGTYMGLRAAFRRHQ